MSSRPFWSKTGALTTTPTVLFLPDGWGELKISVDALCLGQVGPSYTAPAVAAVNGITTISSAGVPTGGMFQLRVAPADSDIVALTSALTFDESAADIKTALVATGLFASGDITAAGGALPTAVTLTWTGVYAATVPPIEVVSPHALTGGTNPSVAARTTTNPAGNGKYGYLASGVQEVWSAAMFGSKINRFLYLAAVTGTANYYITAYR